MGQELVTFLQFYHDQGSLLCHGQGGGQLVLLSPQWLVQLFTDAISAKRDNFQVGGLLFEYPRTVIETLNVFLSATAQSIVTDHQMQYQLSEHDPFLL